MSLLSKTIKRPLWYFFLRESLAFNRTKFVYTFHTLLWQTFSVTASSSSTALPHGHYFLQLLEILSSLKTWPLEPSQSSTKDTRKGAKCQIYGHRRRFDFRWSTHNAIYRCCIIELYTWNLYNYINQCHSNKFNKNK